MAQRRMISKSISTSTKLAEVSLFAKLLFTWIIPHCDDYGHIDGSPKIVKGIVVPLCDETVEDVGKAIDELTKVGLIERYEVKGRSYIGIMKWEDHQTLRTDRPLRAEHPSNNDGNPRKTTGKPQGENSRSKLSEAKLSEAKRLLGDFEEFWKLYPNKKSKKKAQQTWLKVSPSIDLVKKIIIAVTTQAKSEQWLKDDGRFIPHPTTWLNGERWNDEIKIRPNTGGKYETIKQTTI